VKTNFSFWNIIPDSPYPTGKKGSTRLPFSLKINEFISGKFVN